MASFPENSALREELLDQAVASYLKALDAGTRPDRGEWLRRYPDVAAELQGFFEGLDQLAALEPERRPAPEALPAGTAFAHFDLLEEIACGGMGVVYRAWDRKRTRAVALKIVLGSGSSPGGGGGRFLREREAAAVLRHPHIVPVLETGECQGRLYLAMAFMEGGSLAQALPSFLGDYRRVASLLEKTARAVHFAHEHGIVHRDLKPGNILLDRRGEPSVSDFGLASFLDHPDHLTCSGAILGTLKYMAPEQALGQRENVGPAADVYSLGVILYELLTGAPPFAGKNCLATLRKLVQEEPKRPSAVESEVPRELEAICLTSIEKSPRRRYPSAGDLAADLKRFLGGKPVRARPPGRTAQWARRIRARRAAAGLVAVSILAVVLLAAFGAAYTLEVRRAADRERQRATEALGEAAARRRLIRHQERAQATRMAFEAWDHAFAERARELLSLARPDPDDPSPPPFEVRYLEGQLGQEGTALQAGSGPVAGLAFLAQGALLVAAADGTLRSLACPGGEVLSAERPPGAEGLRAFAAAEGGDLAAAGSGSGSVFLLGGEGRVLRTFEVFPAGGLRALALSPRGGLLATGSREGEVKILDIAGGEVRGSRRFPHRIAALAFSPAGDVLAVASGDTVELWNLWDGATRMLEGRRGRVYALDWTARGGLLAAGCEDGSCQLWDARTGALRALLAEHAGAVSRVQFSPGGDLLATASRDWTVRIWEVATLERRLVLRGHRSALAAVAFSADGRLLASAGTGGGVKLWDPRESRCPLRLGRHGDVVRHVACWADGRTLVTASQDYTLNVWTLLAERGKVEVRHAWTYRTDPEGLGKAQLSPAGRRAAVAREDGSVEVHRLEEAAGEAGRGGYRMVLEATLDPRAGRVTTEVFSGDEGLLATAGDSREVCLWRRRDAGGAPRWERVETFPVPFTVWEGLFSPDGRLLVLAEYDAEGRLALWDTRRHRFSAVFRAHCGRVRALAISPDCHHLAAGGEGSTVRVWWIEEGPSGLAAGERTTLAAHNAPVAAVAFSPDGATLLTAGTDGVVKAWGILASSTELLGVCRAVLGDFETPVTALGFSPGGSFAVLGGGVLGRGEVWVLHAGR